MSSAGEIVDTNQNVIGEHDGVHAYTIGQRRGIPEDRGAEIRYKN